MVTSIKFPDYKASEMARDLGINAATVSRVFDAGSEVWPSFATAQRIASYLDISMDALFIHLRELGKPAPRPGAGAGNRKHTP